MKINNVTQIRAGDFGDDDQQMAEQLGNILNPFMQQVVELSDGRIDFENKTESYIEIEMTVDVNGTPVLNDKISTGKSFVRGFHVIDAHASANAAIGATGSPFIVFTRLASGFVKVSKITGLPANTKMRLNVIVY